MFLREYLPQTLRDAWRAAFEQLRHGTMSVSEYAVRFSDLSRHAPALVSSVRERVRRFIEWLSHGIRFNMAGELEADVPFQQVVDIAQRLEGMWVQEGEVTEAKRPRRLGGSTSPYFGGRV
ncbi:uncharacterized protein [Nicotiana tomentosiformis]|uniref:uncharacterized protein n=1 Tax=Nicotiana tomentosiformis TaxID=4098 RepID=UPI00388CA8B2